MADHAFTQVIADARTRTFEWGLHDCVTFASAAVRARTQRDVLAEIGLFPAWRTALEAAHAIESVGGLHAALTHLFGEPVAILAARAGDVAIVRDPERPSRELLAVCHHGVLLAPSLRGLAVLSLATALAAWKVAP